MPVVDVQVEQLEGALADSSFRNSFDRDPVAAARDRGLDQVAAEFEQFLANPQKLAAAIPDTEAHGLPDKATQTRLVLLLASSAAVASLLGGSEWG